MTTTINLLVGSKNPVKINATKAAFQAYFPDHQINAIGINAPSGVPEQPMNEQETLLGAKNRVAFCLAQNDNKHLPQPIDYAIAIEGGVDNYLDGPAAFAYVAIARDGSDRMAIGKSAQLPLPETVYKALVDGQELGDVIDNVFQTHNAKQKTGAMGLFTNNLVTRQSTYEQALILALAKIVNAPLYES